ncbi:calcium-binding protein [Actinoplanes sp. URMC 104]|uniref:calcium-binding protein n=1 Tax=Actinoplanes sp. URMC 104 TaxID=3423409 RepID=UPI003F1DA3CD
MLGTAAAGTLVLVALPADAATGGRAAVVGSGVVQYQAAQGRVNGVVVTRSGSTVTIDDRTAITPGAGCKAVDSTTVRCATARPTWVRLYLYDGNDVVVNKTDLPMSADGGSGADKLTGGPKADILKGGEGNDAIWGLGGNDGVEALGGNDRVSGGDGNDAIEDGDGNDVILGGNGDDSFTVTGGNDTVDGGPGDDSFTPMEVYGPDPADRIPDADRYLGGPGADSIGYDYYAAAVRLDPDGVTGDDGKPGEHDTISSDIESITGGEGADWISGGPRGEYLGGGGGNDAIHGNGGNDQLSGNAGKDALSGGAGDDQLFGDDHGAWADRLDAGAGNDLCTAGRGDVTAGCERTDPEIP